MEAAEIASPDNVHFVQIKCPLLSQARVAALRAAGDTPATGDTLASMGLSRGASALGVAVALGEIEMGEVTKERIGRDASLFSSRASASAGAELANHEVVVLGMSRSWGGDLSIAHAVMADAVDVASVRTAAEGLGLTMGDPAGLIAVLAKAEASKSGRVRGARHTMLDDSDISSTRHARGFVGGVLAGQFGITELFVSGGAEHQGPDGGGPVAMIARAVS